MACSMYCWLKIISMSDLTCGCNVHFGGLMRLGPAVACFFTGFSSSSESGSYDFSTNTYFLGFELEPRSSHLSPVLSLNFLSKLASASWKLPLPRMALCPRSPTRPQRVYVR